MPKYKHYTKPCLTNALRYEIDNHEDNSVNREDKYKALESYKGAETRFARPPRALPKPCTTLPNSQLQLVLHYYIFGMVVLLLGGVFCDG